MVYYTDAAGACAGACAGAYAAAPAMVRRGGEVWLYVQEEVPGVTIDSTTPRLTYAHMVKHERPSGVVRYAFPCDKLAKWTEAALKEWKAAYGGASRTFLSTCGSDAETASAKAYSPRSAACQWNPRVHSTAHRHVPPEAEIDKVLHLQCTVHGVLRETDFTYFQPNTRSRTYESQPESSQLPQRRLDTYYAHGLERRRVREGPHLF